MSYTARNWVNFSTSQSQMSKNNPQLPIKFYVPAGCESDVSTPNYEQPLHTDVCETFYVFTALHFSGKENCFEKIKKN